MNSNSTGSSSVNGHANRLTGFWQSEEARQGFERFKECGKPPPEPPAASVKRRVEQVVKKLGGGEPTATGYSCRCPAHDDNKPSLNVGEGDNGNVVLHCHAGCEVRDVLDAVELSYYDLDPSNPFTTTVNHYQDEDGNLLFQVLRSDPKGFRMRQPDGLGGWTWSMKGARRALYLLPLLLAADPDQWVFVVEGEKSADELVARGAVATCSPGGAGKWRDEYAAHLAGMKVAILADNDDLGRKHARQVAESVYHTAAVVKVVELHGLPDKGDVYDWLNEGGTEKELESIIKATPDYTPSAGSKPAERINEINQSPPKPVAPPLGRGNQLIRLIPPVLGPDAYHGVFGGFLRDVGPLTEATDAGILAHLVVAAGALIGAGPFVYAGGKQYARVNAVIVGPTNEGRKGTGGSLVRESLQAADPAFTRTQWVSGLSSGEGLAEKVADKTKKDKDGKETPVPTEKRLGVVEEEFSKVFAQIRRDGNILSETVRQAFDSGDLGVLTRNAPLRATGAHICIVGHITPEELREKLGGTEQANGFGNRFLWIASRSDKVLSRTAPIPPKVVEPLARRLKEVAKYPTGHIPLSNDAQGVWDELYPALREDKPDLAGAMTARGAAFVLRLALIYCLLDKKSTRSAIRPDHLRAALAVWEYSVASAYLLFKSETGSALGDKLLSLLAAGPMKRNQFTDHIARPSGEIEAELNKLLTAERVTKTKLKPTGVGRPAEVWQLADATGN